MLSLEVILAGVMLLALTIYALLAGADFGGGVWDLFARGPRAKQQREQIAEAIGPIWEANHVWLILVVVILFTAFPPAFVAIMTALHIPLTIMLVGIVLRGTAFTFRTYDVQRDDVQQRWSVVFAISSIFTPVMLGVCIGAIASGSIGYKNGVVQTDFFSSWLAPFPFAVGGFALALFTFLAAVYLTVESADPGTQGDPFGIGGHEQEDDSGHGGRAHGSAELQDDFRRRALGAAVAVGVMALIVFFLSTTGAPRIRAGLIASPWSWPLQIATGVVSIGAIWTLWVRRFHLARAFAALQVILILWGWGVAQFPYLVEPDITIEAAAGPDITLKLLIGALAVGALVLIPSFFVLFRVFKGKQAFAVLPQANKE